MIVKARSPSEGMISKEAVPPYRSEGFDNFGNAVLIAMSSLRLNNTYLVAQTVTRMVELVNSGIFPYQGNGTLPIVGLFTTSNICTA